MVTTTRLYIPQRTRLETVWRVTTPDGQNTYQVWTSCADRNAPFAQMLGTCMMLAPNGMVTRVTVRPDATTDIMVVMPAVGD